MKTEEVLDKYKKLLSGLLKCKEEKLRFFKKSSSGYGCFWGNNLENILKDKTVQEIKEIKYFEPEKDKEGNETVKQIELFRCNNCSEGGYCITIGNDILATFELYKMPHCCAIIVSCKAFVSEKYRGKRVGTTMNNLRQDIGRLLGYSLMFCTDIETNINQRKLLKTNGWKDLYEVINRRTNNRVYLSVINL